jgi:hypothetical protein
MQNQSKKLNQLSVFLETMPAVTYWRKVFNTLPTACPFTNETIRAFKHKCKKNKLQNSIRVVKKTFMRTEF